MLIDKIKKEFYEDDIDEYGNVYTHSNWGFSPFSWESYNEYTDAQRTDASYGRLAGHLTCNAYTASERMTNFWKGVVINDLFPKFEETFLPLEKEFKSFFNETLLYDSYKRINFTVYGGFEEDNRQYTEEEKQAHLNEVSTLVSKEKPYETLSEFVSLLYHHVILTPEVLLFVVKLNKGIKHYLKYLAAEMGDCYSMVSEPAKELKTLNDLTNYWEEITFDDGTKSKPMRPYDVIWSPRVRTVGRFHPSHEKPMDRFNQF